MVENKKWEAKTPDERLRAHGNAMADALEMFADTGDAEAMRTLRDFASAPQEIADRMSPIVAGLAEGARRQVSRRSQKRPPRGQA